MASLPSSYAKLLKGEFNNFTLINKNLTTRKLISNKSKFNKFTYNNVVLNGSGLNKKILKSQYTYSGLTRRWYSYGLRKNVDDAPKVIALELNERDAFLYSNDGKHGNNNKEDNADNKDKGSDEFFRGFGKGGRSDRKEGDKPPLPEMPPWPNPPMWWNVVVLATLVAGSFMLFQLLTKNLRGTEIDWTTFQHKLLEKGEVEKLEVSDDQVSVYLKGQALPSYHFTIGSVSALEKKLEATQAGMGVPLWDYVPVVYKKDSITGAILRSIPGLLLVGLLFYAFRQSMKETSNIFPIGGKKMRHITNEMKPNIKFSDVAGLDEAKVEITEFVNFLQHPVKYKELGAKIPRGALLMGPPGTGKTLLAKATAGEAGVPFFSVSGSDFVEMFVGVGPARVRELFAEARKKAPCIVFIDEIDAVGRKRAKGAGGMGNSNDERENTLNQLLVEMDGFNSNSSVIVLAGTNRADVLDPALLRPGRFDRTIPIDPPDKKGRNDIFKVYLKSLTLEHSPEHYSERLASLTPGFVGADIANVCNEAALIAARHEKTKVDMSDFEAAIERVVGGLERKTKVLSPKEKKIIAYHEAGHAVVGWFLEHASPLLKVSIIPRGSSALGYAQYQPRENYLYSVEQLGDIMCMTLGGRPSEQIIFSRISSGAEDDLKKVTSMAAQKVTKFGMSKKVGLVSFSNNNSDGMIATERLYSHDTGRLIDEEVRAIVNKAYKRTLQILEEHRPGLEAVAQRLLEKENLSETDLIEILGERPFPKRIETITPRFETLDSPVG